LDLEWDLPIGFSKKYSCFYSLSLISVQMMVVYLVFRRLQYPDIALGEIGMTTHISIGQIKRDISELVNRVAYGGERIVLTSRGRAKAALVSLEDYEKLQQNDASISARAAWLSQAQELAERIRQRRAQQPIDVQALLDESRADLEGRDDR
jgi:prevent-host-death family protein